MSYTQANLSTNSDANLRWTFEGSDGPTTLVCDFITIPTLASAVTLTTQQSKASIIDITVGHASNAITIALADAQPGSLYIVSNNDATLAANIKVAGGTAITVAATKTAIVRVNALGTDLKRVTLDT